MRGPLHRRIAMTSPHDALFRHTFGAGPHAEALLRAILPAALVAAIDWATLQSCPATMSGADLRLHAADLLFVVRLRGSDLLLAILLEHKSSPEADTAEQVLTYVLHLRREWREGLRPLVAAVVVYHGERAWPHGTGLPLPAGAGALDPTVAAAIAPLQLQLRFLLDDLTRCSEADLRARAMTPQGTLTLSCLRFLREWSPAQAEAGLRRWVDLLCAVAAAPGGREGLRAVESYAIHVTEIPAERLASLFARAGGAGDEEFIMSTAEKLIAKGEARGERAGRVEILLRVLRSRFGAVPDAFVARLRTATVAELDRCADRLLAAATIDEVFAG
jgi:hypothetical protein